MTFVPLPASPIFFSVFMPGDKSVLQNGESPEPQTLIAEVQRFLALSILDRSMSEKETIAALQAELANLKGQLAVMALGPELATNTVPS